jgi:hypothetical protein
MRQERAEQLLVDILARLQRIEDLFDEETEPVTRPATSNVTDIR